MTPRPRPAPDVVHDRVGDRVVLIDGDGREIITLNPVGALVWRAMDGERDIDAIASVVYGEVDGAELAVVTEDVRAFVDELYSEGLATWESE